MNNNNNKTISDKRLSRNLTRRQFIRRAGAAATAIAVADKSPQFAVGKVRGANERLGVGYIGCGGRSNAHLKTVPSARCAAQTSGWGWAT
jgi:hypothetical protein